MAAPLTDAQIQQILELHAEGMPRNKIAELVGCSAGAVSKYVAKAGLSFERGEMTAAATAAAVADAKTRRAELVLKLLDDAERLRQQIFAPAIAFNFGGRDNTYAEHPLPEPMPADKRNLVQSIAAVVATSIKIDQHDRTDEALSELDLWLKSMVPDDKTTER